MRLLVTVPDRGAYPSVFAAASPKVFENREDYYGKCIDKNNDFFRQSSTVLDEAQQKELSEFTEKFLTEIDI